MKDALIFLMLLVLGLPLGAGLVVFLRWLGRQKTDIRSQQQVASGWAGGLTGAISLNLLMAVLNDFRHDPNAVQRSLVEAAIFTSMFFGARIEAKRQQK